MNLDTLDSLPLVKRALSQYHEAHQKEIESCESLDELIRWNVKTQLQSLMSYPFVQERLKSGQLNLSGIVYNFHKATVEYKCSVNTEGVIKDED